MKNNQHIFDFDKVGKRLPYNVPDGFFDNSEQRLKTKVNAKQHTIKWHYVAVATVAVLIGLAAVIRLSYPKPENTNTIVYGSTEQQNNEWTDFAEADIFMENMNW